jgi:hypothetical protein
MKIRNKGTNVIFTDLSEFVLDAQKKYNRLNDLVYCDIECILRDPNDLETVYVLDECGNWNYFPSDLYELIWE